MASPNIVNVTTITGVTASSQLTTSNATIVSNASNSNQVYKINSIIASNKSGSTATVSVYYNTGASGGGTNISLATGVDVATKTSLVVLDKSSTIYLEEARSIVAVASATSAIDLVISYEVIS